jgi:hypothetical protein
VKHSDGVSGFLTRRISKWDAKTKTGNIDPLLTYINMSIASSSGFIANLK